MSILDVQNLSVTYMTKHRPPFQAVKDVSLTIQSGEVMGLVGESGCGKSTLGTAILRLLDPPGTITGGKILFDGKDITNLPEDKLRPLRWSEISTVFQSSMNALNPVVNIGKQFSDVIETHTNFSEREIEQRIAELLRLVDIDPSFAKFYPHELSGGMKQRVAIALALALEPKLVILDEPTTGLDVVVQRSILDSLKRIQRQQKFAVLIISHDLGAIMEVADRVAVMFNGEIVDDQPARDILLHPKHEYSRVLIGSYEELWKPVAEEMLSGEVEGTANYANEKPTMVVKNISRIYSRRRGLTKSDVRAVDNVSFSLRKGYITALVGQSGSGKSTIGKLVTGVERPDSGSIQFGDVRIDQLPRKHMKSLRAKVQLIFQDPYSALNPAHTIYASLSRPLANYLDVKGKVARQRVEEVLEQVGLEPASRFIDVYPHQLSGGQRQRVVVARALLSDPEIVIADEPTSMLDVTIRAEILEILNRLVRDKGIAMLYITHDLLSARALADEIIVLNKGKVVESGDASEVIAHPEDDYTNLLLNSIPNPFTEIPLGS